MRARIQTQVRVRERHEPARHAPDIPLSEINKVLDETKDRATQRGHRVVGESGFLRLKDGSVRLYFQIQTPTEEER